MKRVIITVICLCLVAMNVLLPMQPAHAFAAESAIVYGLISGLLSLGTGMATSSSYNMQVIDAIRNSGQNFIDDFKAWPFTVAGSVMTGAALIESLTANNIVDGKLQVGKGVLQAVSGWLSNFSKNNEFRNIDVTSNYVVRSGNPSYYYYVDNVPVGSTISRTVEQSSTGHVIKYHYDCYKIYGKSVTNPNSEDYRIYYLYKPIHEEVIVMSYREQRTTDFGCRAFYITDTQVDYPTTGNSIMYACDVRINYNGSIYNSPSIRNKTNSYNSPICDPDSYNPAIVAAGQDAIHLLSYSTEGLSAPVDYTDSGNVWQTWDDFEAENDQQTTDLVIAAPLPSDDDTDVYTALQALLAQGVSGVDAISQALVNVLKGAIAETTEAVNAGTGEIVDALTNTATLDMDMNKMSIPALIVTKFPFCIPFDLYNAFNTFAATGSTPPEFNLPLTYNGTTANINIKFSQFQVWANIVRWGILISFNVGLIVITRKLIKG